MKLVTAVVGPHALEDVKAALLAFGIGQITISEVAGVDDGRYGTYRGTRFAVTVPWNRVEVVCDVFDAEAVSNVIGAAAGNGDQSAGIVWISDIDRVVRVHAPLARAAAAG